MLISGVLFVTEHGCSQAGSGTDVIVSQPGFSRIVPRVLVSCISRQDTYPKCLPSNRMLNDHPGPLYITSKVYRPLQAP